MAFHEHVPELIIGPHAQMAIDQADRDELVKIYSRLFSLLKNPAVDYEFKTDLLFFPYGPEMGVRQLLDDSFVIT
jgi:hypothetical protein